MKRIIIGAGATAALAVGVALAGSGSTGAASAPAPAKQGPAVTTLSGFELSDDVKSAAAFTGNDLIFDGTVVGAPEKARRVLRKLPDGATIDYVYTPIPVRVDRVRKGSGIKAGQVVRVRALGGSTGTNTTVSELGPQAADFGNGLKLTLFTQPLLDAGDGLKAITPNFSFGHQPVQGVVYALGGHGKKETTRIDAFQKVLQQVK